MRGISRRRFISISAAAAGAILVPHDATAAADSAAAVWHGTMMGATAMMKIHHPVKEQAERLIAAAREEARRLEGLFSLYREDSALAELNRTGVLVGPSAELVDLLTISLHYAKLTGGMFDPTVQPLWELYAAHFSKTDADPSGPPPALVEATLARVGYERLSVSPDRIVMPKETRITLNGIAQGYVTDRIVDLLRSQGIRHSLVDMGEARAIGSRPDGQAWEVGVADPEVAGRVQAALPIIDRAVSTSGAYGFRFDPDGHFNHLFNPTTAGCAELYRSVTTVAHSATTADALSTAFSLMAEVRIKSLLPQLDVDRVHLIDSAGAVSEIVA